MLATHEDASGDGSTRNEHEGDWQVDISDIMIGREADGKRCGGSLRTVDLQDRLQYAMCEGRPAARRVSELGTPRATSGCNQVFVVPPSGGMDVGDALSGVFRLKAVLQTR